MDSKKRFPLLATDIDFKPRELNVPHKPHHFMTKKVAVLGIVFLLVALLASVGMFYIRHFGHISTH